MELSNLVYSNIYFIQITIFPTFSSVWFLLNSHQCGDTSGEARGFRAREGAKGLRWVYEGFSRGLRGLRGICEGSNLTGLAARDTGFSYLIHSGSYSFNFFLTRSLRGVYERFPKGLHGIYEESTRDLRGICEGSNLTGLAARDTGFSYLIHSGSYSFNFFLTKIVDFLR